MEKELFLANNKGDVKALGMNVDCSPADLHIYVNGEDLTKSVRIEEIRITFEKPPTVQLPAAMLSKTPLGTPQT